MLLKLIIPTALTFSAIVITSCKTNKVSPKVEESAEVKTNFIYEEIENKGRIYVIGTEKGKMDVQKHGHLPIAKTFIGEGPKGETLIFELDKKNPDLLKRLISNYELMHKVQL
ncbi:MAG: hypothetical protein MK193_09540 [Lentisphaeria bacterium]|nr:hypothetical protein [Lentisphaeria bacterium]